MPSSVTKYMIDTSKARFSRVAQMVSKVRPVVVCFLSNTAWVSELGKPHIVFSELGVNPLETYSIVTNGYIKCIIWWICRNNRVVILLF